MYCSIFGSARFLPGKNITGYLGADASYTLLVGVGVDVDVDAISRWTQDGVTYAKYLIQ